MRSHAVVAVLIPNLVLAADRVDCTSLGRLLWIIIIRLGPPPLNEAWAFLVGQQSRESSDSTATK